MAAECAAALAKDYSFLEFDVQGRVLVDVHSGLNQEVGALQNELQSNLGFKTTGVYPSQNMVTGWLPVNQILNLPTIAKFAYVTPVYKPIASWQLPDGRRPGHPFRHLPRRWQRERCGRQSRRDFHLHQPSRRRHSRVGRHRRPAG